MAMRALQKKKRLEKNLEQIDSTHVTLEIQKDTLQNAKTNAVVLESIKNAGEAIRKANIKLLVITHLISLSSPLIQSTFYDIGTATKYKI